MSFMLLALLSCITAKQSVSKESIGVLDALIQKQRFNIVSDWAYPQTTAAMQQVLNSGLLQPGNSASNISLIGNTNFLTVSGDSISSYLPYFGERQMHVDYGGGDSAIEFNGMMQNYRAEKNKDHSYTITFDAKSNSESFKVQVKIFPNLRIDMILNGAYRFLIRYSGTLEEATE